MTWRNGTARTRAKTPAGMLVKAPIAATDPTAVSMVDDLEQALEERLSTDHFNCLSLILDVLHMNGGKREPCSIPALALLRRELD